MWTGGSGWYNLDQEEDVVKFNQKVNLGRRLIYAQAVIDTLNYEQHTDIRFPYQDLLSYVARVLL